jgi:hypothetical protein
MAAKHISLSHMIYRITKPTNHRKVHFGINRIATENDQYPKRICFVNHYPNCPTPLWNNETDKSPESALSVRQKDSGLPCPRTNHDNSAVFPV